MFLSVPVLRIIERVFPLVRDILGWYPDSPGEEFLGCRVSSKASPHWSINKASRPVVDQGLVPFSVLYSAGAAETKVEASLEA